MKRLLLFAALLLGGISTSYGQYCEAGGPGFTGDSNVGTVDLIGETTNISFVGCANDVLGWDDQTAMVADLEIGGDYSVDIDWSTCGGPYGNSGSVWIDFDGSQTFDVGELIGSWTGIPPSGIQNYPFTVPVGSPIGMTRMRVLQQEGGAQPLDPCGSFGWGSLTDFGINLSCPVPHTLDYIICTGTSTTITATTSSASNGIAWYDAGMTLLGPGPSYITPVLGATTVYNATVVVPAGTCMGESAPVMSTVTVSPVDVVLTPIDETCLGINDGSFSLTSTVCGVAPFTYSVDGGAFGPIPTNLGSGTYSIVVEDANTDQSAPIALTIGATATVAPGDAIVSQTSYSFCSTDGTMPITAALPQLTCSTSASASGFDDAATTATITDFSCATGPISSATLDVVFGGNCLAWSSYDIWVNGAPVATQQCSQTGFDLTPYLPLTSVELISNDEDVFSDFITIDATVNLTSTDGTLVWYDMAVAGTPVGAGSPLETIGTTVMPVAATGTYDYYVGVTNGCFSANNIQVTVNVNDVLVGLTAVDETCAGNSDGTFTISSVSCGTAPFLVSVDGGAFGPIPNNLTAGTYSIVVEDAGALQSAPISLTIVATSSVAPNNPVVTTPVFDFCSGTPSMPIDAMAPAGSCSVSGSASGQDDAATTVTITDFSCAPGGINNATLDATIGGFCTAWYSYDIIVNGATVATQQCDQTGFDLTPYLPLTSVELVSNDEDVFSDFITINATVNLDYVEGTLEWFDMAVGGTLLGTGSPLEAVGTSVMPTPTVGTYDFYVGTTNGCVSGRELVQVVVSDVLVELTPQDETCTAYANGTFSITNVSCGTAPFTFSVDGGAFGPAPTNLTAGTYSVVVQDAGGLNSNAVSVVIGTTETVIPDAPVVTDTAIYACAGDLSILVGAAANYLSGSLLTTMAGGNGFNGNTFGITATNAVTIDQFSINANPGTLDFEVWYRPDDYLLTPGSELATAGWTLAGTATGVASANPAATLIPINVAVSIPAGQTYSFVVVETSGAGIAYTNGTAVGNVWAADANITVYEGHGGDYFGGPSFSPRNFNGEVFYSSGVNGTVAWFDMPTGGTEIGTGSPFETVGTPVMPASTQGVYPFYAGLNNNGCYSPTTTLVNVYVDPVNVELASIDADCNGANTGSFSISNVLCGLAPFTFSVDGGAFGPAPTDLLPGVHTIIVMDANSDVSAPISFVIGEAAAPDQLVMTTITDDGGQVSWVSNGTETSWFVEWGLPGFMPGTGAEIGSATEADTFSIITGLNGNTTYDIWVAADCGAGQTVGSWTMITFTTACGIYTTPFIETFEDNSDTRVCWWNMQEVGTADWTYDTGAGGGSITTAFEGTKNARFVSQPGTADPVTKLVSPRFDFTGQDSVALVFAYGQEFWAPDQNITNVYVNGPSSPFVQIQSYLLDTPQWTVDTLFLADTTYEVAFEGVNNWGRANVIDYVQFLPCNLNPGTDGEADVCRLDSTFNLNSIVTFGEDFGNWSFPANETFIVNDSIATVGFLPAGVYEFLYIVKTPCAADTTVATLTVYGPSSAGTDGTLTVCMNQPIDLLAGLGGNVDLGGTWYDPVNAPLANSAITASFIPGSFNYDYVTTNGVCPNDTSNVVVTVLPSCDYLTISELMFDDMTLYPNPTFGSVFITNDGSNEVFDYELTDAHGRVITAKKAAINGTETTEVKLGALEPGLYLIRVYNENGERTFRLVKE